MTTNEIYCEYNSHSRLLALDEHLHSLLIKTVKMTYSLLDGFRRIFPAMTDHSIIHCIGVEDSMDKLIGENIDKLNADELYVALMAVYLHDIGMSLSDEDYKEFFPKVVPQEWIKKHPDKDMPKIIRSFHSEFSACAIEKYAELFEFPSEKHKYAVKQVSLGHRKLDLFDEAEFPEEYRLDNGNVLHIAYLAALLRLADDLDLSSGRNVSIRIDFDSLVDEMDIKCFRRQAATQFVQIEHDAVILYLNSQQDKVPGGYLKERAERSQSCLDLCRSVVAERSPFTISQTQVLMRNYEDRIQNDK